MADNTVYISGKKSLKRALEAALGENVVIESYKVHNDCVLSLSTMAGDRNGWTPLDFFPTSEALARFVREWLDRLYLETGLYDDEEVEDTGFTLYTNDYLAENLRESRPFLNPNRHIAVRIEPKVYKRNADD
mgnify:CR=1 FL=1